MNKVKAFCKKHDITENQFYGIDKIGGYLDLGSLTSIPEGFNPTVGGSLYLGSLTSIPEGFNPTVGGYLDLGSLTSIPEGFNPTVGGSLDLCSLTSKNKKRVNINTPPTILTWKNGKYVFIDGILSEVISKHGNSWKATRVGKKEIEYVVTDGEGRYSHGTTMAEARDSLIYKLKDRDTSKYENLKFNSVLSFEEAIQCYRAITGACEAGTRGFIATHERKESYTIREIIELTRGNWGANTFAAFFNKGE